MKDLKFRDYIHGIFFVLFSLVNFAIFFYVKFRLGRRCECANDKVIGLVKPLDYITWFSLAGGIMGIINILININQGFSSLPIVGTIFNFGIAFMCIIQAFMLVKFLGRTDDKKCIDAAKCQNKEIKTISKVATGFGMFIYLGAIVLAILLVWL
jgi:hypothetical protein